jgi:hypothetical protein
MHSRRGFLALSLILTIAAMVPSSANSFRRKTAAAKPDDRGPPPRSDHTSVRRNDGGHRDLPGRKRHLPSERRGRIQIPEAT